MIWIVIIAGLTCAWLVYEYCHPSEYDEDDW